MEAIACEPSPCTLEEGGKRALRAAFKIVSTIEASPLLPDSEYHLKSQAA